MARNRFVKPNVVRLPLSDGDWIDVKKELNAGEQRRVFAKMVKDYTAGEKATLNPEQVGLTKVVEYLVAWSFADDTGRAVPVSEAAINNLDTDTFSEIRDAIDAHEDASEKEVAARKNVQAGESPSSLTSPSVAG